MNNDDIIKILASINRRKEVADLLKKCARSRRANRENGADDLEACALWREQEIEELIATLDERVEQDCDRLFRQIAQLLRAAEMCGKKEVIGERLLRAIQ